MSHREFPFYLLVQPPFRRGVYLFTMPYLLVSATPGMSSMSKRPREEEEESAATLVTDTESAQEDSARAPIPKKLRIVQRVGPEVRRGAQVF